MGLPMWWSSFLTSSGVAWENVIACRVFPVLWSGGELFEIAKKQTMAGIAFAGIERLPQEQRPPKDILLQWYKISLLIKKSNADLNRKCAAVSEKFRSEGFENCILLVLFCFYTMGKICKLSICTGWCGCFLCICARRGKVCIKPRVWL